MKKIVCIVNPISGTRKDKKRLVELLSKHIDTQQYALEIVYTQRAGHATQLAAESAMQGVDIVVAVGGDGTVNEVARALIGTSTALAIIPCGSGNGLARHLHIPMEAKQAIEAINHGELQSIDYGLINGTPFFCTCGMGFDAFVSLKFAKAGRRGVLTYLEQTLLESLKYKPETYELETEDGTYRHQAFLIACGNASQYGNNAYIAPRATLTDGLLDVTVLEPFTVMDVPSLAFQLFNKTIDQNSRIKTFRCRRLTVKRTAPGIVHFDGDPMTTSEQVDIELVPAGLHVWLPGASGEEQSVLKRAQSYINGWKQLSDTIVENLASHNRNLLKRLTPKKDDEVADKEINH